MDKNKLTKVFAKAVSQHSMNVNYIPFANFDTIATCGLAWLELDIEIPYKQINEEIKNIEEYFVDHRNDYNTNAGWQSFCLHGKSYDSTREDEFYNDERPKVWTKEAEKFMPATVNFFKHSWPCTQYSRLRIMKLSPGAIIEVHQDDPSPGKLSPINIAITQPKNCNFYIEGHGIVPFKEGKAFWLNVGLRHCVINNSNEYRYHIIVHHQNNNKEFENLVIRSYNKVYGHCKTTDKR